MDPINASILVRPAPVVNRFARCSPTFWRGGADRDYDVLIGVAFLRGASEIGIDVRREKSSTYRGCAKHFNCRTDSAPIVSPTSTAGTRRDMDQNVLPRKNSLN